MEAEKGKNVEITRAWAERRVRGRRWRDPLPTDPFGSSSYSPRPHQLERCNRKRIMYTSIVSIASLLSSISEILTGRNRTVTSYKWSSFLGRSFGILPRCLRDFYRILVVVINDPHRILGEEFWRIFGGFCGDFCGIFAGFLGDICGIFVLILWDTCEIFAGFLRDFCRICGIFAGFLWDFLDNFQARQPLRIIPENPFSLGSLEPQDLFGERRLNPWQFTVGETIPLYHHDLIQRVTEHTRTEYLQLQPQNNNNQQPDSMISHRSSIQSIQVDDSVNDGRHGSIWTVLSSCQTDRRPVSRMEWGREEGFTLACSISSRVGLRSLRRPEAPILNSRRQLMVA